MGLVELLPESVQQQVRDGAIAAHVAMKFLVPVARSKPEDSRRMAEGFARYRLSSREADSYMPHGVPQPWRFVSGFWMSRNCF
jgi:hypothetical protein